MRLLVGVASGDWQGVVAQRISRAKFGFITDHAVFLEERTESGRPAQACDSERDADGGFARSCGPIIRCIDRCGFHERAAAIAVAFCHSVVLWPRSRRYGRRAVKGHVGRDIAGHTVLTVIPCRRFLSEGFREADVTRFRAVYWSDPPGLWR